MGLSKNDISSTPGTEADLSEEKPPEPATVPCTLRELLLYFLRLGTFGFGGPIALAGHMQRDLVESRHWVAKEDYVEGLAFSQLSPGPLAAQLAMYLGWVRAGWIGATLVGLTFILPSFVMVLALFTFGMAVPARRRVFALALWAAIALAIGLLPLNAALLRSLSNRR